MELQKSNEKQNRPCTRRRSRAIQQAALHAERGKILYANHLVAEKVRVNFMLFMLCAPIFDTSALCRKNIKRVSDRKIFLFSKAGIGVKAGKAENGLFRP